jgi:hypothetical protein
MLIATGSPRAAQALAEEQTRGVNCTPNTLHFVQGPSRIYKEFTTGVYLTSITNKNTELHWT